MSIADGVDGRLLVHCHAGCNSLDILAALRRLGLTSGFRRGGALRPSGINFRGGESKVKMKVASSSPKMASILARALPIHGTLADCYLQVRGCGVPVDSDLRYLPPTAEYPWPTMVAIITDFVTGSALSLHFTSLSLDGRSKAPIDKPKRLLGGHRKARGVIRLTDDADVTTHLGFAEGIETALAVTAAMDASAHWLPVWSAIDVGNLASLPVVDGIERLTIFSDTDANGIGQTAARMLAARWHAAGREVFIAQPKAGPTGKRDWNDRVAA